MSANVHEYETTVDIVAKNMTLMLLFQDKKRLLSLPHTWTTPPEKYVDNLYVWSVGFFF